MRAWVDFGCEPIDLEPHQRINLGPKWVCKAFRVFTEHGQIFYRIQTFCDGYYVMKFDGPTLDQVIEEVLDGMVIGLN
jgi:hypothetical protein